MDEYPLSNEILHVWDWSDPYDLKIKALLGLTNNITKKKFTLDLQENSRSNNNGRRTLNHTWNYLVKMPKSKERRIDLILFQVNLLYNQDKEMLKKT